MHYARSEICLREIKHHDLKMASYYSGNLWGLQTSSSIGTKCLFVSKDRVRSEVV